MPCSTGLGAKQADVPHTVLLHQECFQFGHGGSLSVGELFDKLMHASVTSTIVMSNGWSAITHASCGMIQDDRMSPGTWLSYRACPNYATLVTPGSPPQAAMRFA